MSKDIEQLKEMSKTYKELAKILDEAIELEDKKELTDEEKDEKAEELIGRFLIKNIKIKNILEG